MNVFGLGVDTSLQCFIAAEEMGVAQEKLYRRHTRASHTMPFCIFPSFWWCEQAVNPVV